MMSLPAIIGISAGAAGVVACSRKKQPQSLLKKIGFFFLAFIGTVIVMLAVNFALFYGPDLKKRGGWGARGEGQGLPSFGPGPLDAARSDLRKRVWGQSGKTGP